MTALTFPSSPINGQQYDAPNGIQYVFDGVKWIVETITQPSEAVSNSIQDRVAPMFINGESNGITFEYDNVTNTFTSTITNATGYVLPTATGSVLGGVKVGSGLTITDSVLSANIPDVSNFITAEDIPAIPDSILDLGISDGTNGQVLTTNGTGTFTFTTVSGGGDRLTNGANEVVLGTDGTTTLPNALNVANGDNGSISGENGISVRSLNGNQLSLGFTRSLAGMPAPDNANISAFFLDGSGASIEVNTDTAGNIWQFDTNGNTTLPGGIRQSYQDNTSCTAGVDTVIYTSTDGNKHAIKLFVMVEGSQGSSWETQACDIIAVKGFVNDIVHVTAYGVTYSGATPLATFDGRWNALTSKIEITCQPTALNDVRTSVHAIEMTTND